MNTLMRVLRYTKPYWKTLTFSLISATLFGIISAAPTYVLKHTVDEVFIKRYNNLIIPFILLFILVFFLKGLFMYLSSYTMHWVNNRVINDLRHDIFSKLINYPLSFFQKNPTGMLMSHFLNDVQMVQQAATSAIKDGIRSFFEATCLVGFAIYQNKTLGLLMIIIGPLMAITIRNLGRARKNASISIQTQLGMISSLLQEVFVGIREIKAFNAEKTEENRFKNRLQHCFDAIMVSANIECALPAIIEAIAILGCSVIFYVAAHQVLSGVITAGQLTSFIAAVLLAYVPLKKMVNVYSDVQYGLAAAERIFTLTDKLFPATQNRTITLLPFHDIITFQEVSFSYEGAQNSVMENVSFSIRKGDFIGIIGPSGAGKSTLCDLLLGFSVPHEGNIFIDGKPITKASFESLRNNIGYVGQRTFLFNDTVANNVAYSKATASREDIVRACNAAHADKFIRQLPNGYDTVVGENGGQLSGGQKQRLTIARALLKNPEIFIFDEATSSLDDESETMIRQTIETLRGNKTVIIVSHRPSILQNVDRMLLVNNKQVTEVNTLEVLRAFNSPFIS
ncbi:ABC transporter ATP-binding protein [Candidatus Dependentiae bacterium]|nr:ABC transporter ATP-binding protein [Candidatus Dependentiae bacterium]